MANLNCQESGFVKMGYGFTPGKARRNYSDRNDPLHDAFETWIESLPPHSLLDLSEKSLVEQESSKSFSLARSKIKELSDIESRTAEEVHSILAEYSKDGRVRNAGIFLSVFYNCIGQQEIVFDVETEQNIDFIGMGLSAGKILTIRADTGNCIAMRAAGDVINHASVAGSLCSVSEGNAFNYGSAKTFANGSRGFAVNYGTVQEMAENLEGFAVNYGKALFISLSTKNSSGTVNCGKAVELFHDAKGRCVNFGEVEIMSDEAEGMSVNCGIVKGNMYGTDTQSGTLAIKNPKGKFVKKENNLNRNLNEMECKKYPELKQYFKILGKRFEAYRHAEYPKCLEIKDIMEPLKPGGEANTKVTMAFLGMS